MLDVGGAGGYYADWLARRGHRVHMLDPVRLHVDEARRRAGDPPQYTVDVGDARQLPFEDASFDAVLLLGPLYHLVERDDRVRALREAARVRADGGIVCAAAISRYAPALDGIGRRWIVDDVSFRSVQLQLEHGTSGDNQPGFPAISYFHFPDELEAEAREAGLDVLCVYGIEGPAAYYPDLGERWRDPVLRERMLWLARTVERDPRALATSPHLLLVAR